MKRLIRIIAAALACAAVLACVCACSKKNAADLSSTEEEKSTVLRIDGCDVPYEMYRYAVMMHLYECATENDEPSEGEPESLVPIINAYLETLDEDAKNALFDEVREDSVQTLKKIYSLYTLAAANGIEPEGEMITTMVESKMENIRAGYKDDSDYASKIGKFFMNDSVYSTLTRYEVLFEEVYEVALAGGKIISDDNALIDYMMGDDAVRVKQILISFERHSENEAKEIAEEVHALLASHIDAEGAVDQEYFDTLTDEKGEDLFMFKNRDGYYMPRGYDDEKFEAAAFTTPLGGLSDVTRVRAGYTVITRVDKDPDYIKDNIKTLRDACISGQYLIMTDNAVSEAKCENVGNTDVFAVVSSYIAAEK